MERSEPQRPGGIAPTAVFGTVGAIVLVDAFTKFLAVDRLVPVHMPHQVFGEWLRLTLVYNRGAAFGFHLGPYSRWLFIGLTAVALVVLWNLYRTSAATARLRVVALASIAGGAIGNVIDRVRWNRGVVDFLDLGVGEWRWPTFNVADIAVSVGAITLAAVLWREDAAAARAASQGAMAPSADGAPTAS